MPVETFKSADCVVNLYSKYTRALTLEKASTKTWVIERVALQMPTL
jgi:hypothetical protein